MVGVGIAAIALPTLWNYDDRTSVDAIRERELRRDSAADRSNDEHDDHDNSA